MRAIIVAGGRGRRLDPHTQLRPKPLLYVAGRPILAHLLDALPALGITDVVVVVGYLGEQIVEYLRTRAGLPVRIVEQEAPLGNGHAVYAARAYLDRPGLILFGDTIPRGDLRGPLRGTLTAIGVAAVEDGRKYGIAEVDARGRVRRLWEKPAVPPSNLAVAGAYYIARPAPLRAALERLVAQGPGRGGEFWLLDALQLMIDAGEPVGTFTLERFYDCGTPESLLTANRGLMDAAGPVLPAWPGTTVIPPCAIAPTAMIRDSRVGPFVTVAPGAHILRARLRDAIVHPGASVVDATIEHAIIDPAPQREGGDDGAG